MRLVVTGATGVLGSRTVVLAMQAGHEVVALVRSTSSFARLADVQEHLRCSVLPDGPRDLSRVANEIGPVDAVVHTAATYGRDEPFSRIVATNVVFGLELLEAWGPRVSAFVNIGTALPPAVSEYATTKRQFSEWAMERAIQRDWPFADLAVELMYGPGEPEERIVARLAVSCLRNEPSVPLTHGTQVRDFIFVDDVASAALRACTVSIAEPAHRRFTVQVGTGVGSTVREVAETVRREIGASTELAFGELPYRQHEVMHSVAGSSSDALPGWRPTVPLEEGLRRTIAWYQHMTAGSHT